MNVAELLDAAKKAQGFETDMALAKALGISRSAVSAWRSGTKGPDPVQSAALAGYTGIPLAKVLGIVGEARAISAKEKDVWRRLAATATLLAVGVLGGALQPAQAATAGFEAHPVHIMRNNLLWWGRLLRDWLAHKLHRPVPATDCIEARAWI